MSLVYCCFYDKHQRVSPDNVDLNNVQRIPNVMYVPADIPSTNTRTYNNPIYENNS